MINRGLQTTFFYYEETGYYEMKVTWHDKNIFGHSYVSQSFLDVHTQFQTWLNKFIEESEELKDGLNHLNSLLSQ